MIMKFRWRAYLNNPVMAPFGFDNMIGKERRTVEQTSIEKSRESLNLWSKGCLNQTMDSCNFLTELDGPSRSIRTRQLRGTHKMRKLNSS